jgi:hypothetical protein
MLTVAAAIVVSTLATSTAAIPTKVETVSQANSSATQIELGGVEPPSFSPGFGFMVSFSATGHGPGLDDFRQDIDTLVAHGQTWVRMGIIGWEVMGVRGGTRTIQWSESALRQYDAAVDYAYSKGLLIYLVLADAANDPAITFSDYKAIIKDYWDTVAERYAKKVAVWQVYNESDFTHFRLVTQPVTRLTDSYLQDLASVLKIARDSVKAVNPRVLVTTNSTGWPMSDATQARWERYFDGIEANLDVISLDTYPADNLAEIQKLPMRIADAKRRYGKPVIVAEVGLQVAGAWTAEDQSQFVPAAIEAAKEAVPLAIIVYQLRDEGDNSFGLILENRTLRPAFPASIRAMEY